jgi:hypothetical protein
MPGAELNWRQFNELFRLCDKLQAPEAEASLMLAIRLRVQQRPFPNDLDAWAVFRLAGERNDVQLGKAAIRALSTVENSWTDLFEFQYVTADFALTPFPFVAGLYAVGYSIGHDLMGYNAPRTIITART